MTRTFCRAESAPFDSSEFARWTNGVQIHVITATEGHTVDGVPARYAAAKDDAGRWSVKNVVLDVAALDVAAEE